VDFNWPGFIFLSCLAMAAIWGNVLVVLAVYYKRKLQSMFNCFLVSLALSDMMSAMFVMPLSILRTCVGKWPLPLPKFVCVTWYSLDVLFTSSTICHLCMISIDRYLTLTFPLR
ncbi:hypothetical protein HELRODRAFT_140634, partial [Helobdella robusta]|uniref:G-protein coupled receptors family 1 profile domain-containing protein n=1 Tax=Helobdella robusta TaxID=6412 RepID=T1EJ16_HELRO